MELSAVCVWVLDWYTTAAPARKMQYPVVDLRRGLMFAKEASQKHVRIGLFGKVGNFGNSGGNGIGTSEKLPSRRLTEGTPLEKFVL